MPIHRVLQRLTRGALSTLPSVARPLTGVLPQNDRGARLDPSVHLALRVLEAGGNPTFDELGADRARVEFEKLPRLADVPPLPVERVEDQWIPGPDGEIPIRIYRPREAPAPGPAVLYFHGGGWVVGSLASHDATCRFFARRTGLTVIAVDYRLAPEHAFPAAVEDAVAAFRWVRDHGAAFGVDGARIAVAGDSAGGNLAAVVCAQVRDADEPMPAFQLLIYPGTDLTRSMPSHRLFAEGFFLTERTMDWFVASYLTDPSQETDPRGSPLALEDKRGLPPAHVAVAGFDPLRDEGEAYAEALREAGVPTTLRCYESQIHGFVQMGGIVESAAHATDDLAAVLSQRLRA
ncbi:MAG TPA: alpha/beta hydrolase [Sandaracinaceae bacterium LLY-WYZ-13_1]|nr:alpha/beta hydrolase [Sandaracinaceae bacterium LLY-WYZ-13_1]